MTAYPQIRETSGAAGIAINLTGGSAVQAGTTSAAFNKRVYNDVGGALGADTDFIGFLKILMWDGTTTLDSNTYELDSLVVRARVTSTGGGAAAYTSQSVKLGTAHYLPLPTLPPGSYANIEIKVAGPADAPLNNAVQLLLRAVPGDVPVTPDLFLQGSYADTLAQLDDPDPLPRERIIVLGPLHADAQLDEWALDLSNVSPEWTGADLELDIRAIDPGEPITSAGTSVIGTGTTPSIAYDATNMRVTGTDHEVRSFLEGTRFVVDVTGIPTTATPEDEEEEAITVTLAFRRD